MLCPPKPLCSPNVPQPMAVGERAKEAPFFLFLKYLFKRKQQTHNYDSANRFMLNVHYLIEIVKLIILISILISIELCTHGASFAPQKWGKRGPLQKMLNINRISAQFSNYFTTFVKQLIIFNIQLQRV